MNIVKSDKLTFFVLFGKLFEISFVVMNVKRIGNDMESSAGVDYGAGLIIPFCRPVTYFNRFVVDTLTIAVPHFVKHAPSDYRRVVEVALDLLAPLGQNAVNRVGRGVVKSPVRIFAPDDIAQAVAVIEESLLKNLLMQSRSVEAGGERYFYIFYHVAVIGSGVYSVAVEALVEHKTLENGLAVDEILKSVKADIAQTEIALDGVAAEGDDKIIESAAADLPQVLFDELHVAADAARRIFAVVSADQFALVENIYSELAAAAELA